MTKDEGQKYECLMKRLDMIVAILLAQAGLTRKEVAKILGVSEKTIERMFVGKFNRIGEEKHGNT